MIESLRMEILAAATAIEGLLQEVPVRDLQ